MYTIIDDLSIAGGSNYDWSTIRRLDRYVPTQAGAVAYIAYPVDAPFEEDVTSDYPTDSLSIAKKRTVTIECRILSNSTAINTETLIDEDNDALDNALRDIQLAFMGNGLNSQCLGVMAIEYVSATKVPYESKPAYYPFKLEIELNIIYRESRY